ncbi:superoxide dismutase [Candidatus Phytoplasma melaleucae]|uniref:Superoxide dismutase n=1 Tax=Candidatus Phytoplasma melaleucae TaxID=2982630 RepID=A0ABT9DCX6_9MOLU|nr:superoxide dismutase ['Melaleuca sp.' phytoplasma]MDO8167954.1 superoxide dismutase ['Melaleuca sp.' phytoplasma]
MGKYQLPELPYDYNALEPFISSKTMQIHHQKHHKTYVNKLNLSLEKYPQINNSLESLLKNKNLIPEDIRISVQNNGGGHFNHSFFWKVLSSNKNNQMPQPIDNLIKSDFINLDNFKNIFSEKAMNLFGSGWVFWIINFQNKSEILTTKDQNTVLEMGYPLLGLDLWEHAYYLDYQNRRLDYIEAFFNVINWEQIDMNLQLNLSKVK